MTISVAHRHDALDGFAVAVMIALTFSWGLNAVAMKVSNTAFNPVFSTLLRSVIATLAIYLWCSCRGIQLFQRDGTLGAGLLAGALFGAEFILLFASFEFTSVARASLMLNTMPFWMLVGGHLFLGERISPLKFGGLALAFVGVVLIFSDKLSLLGPQAWIGDVMSLVAGALWAATTLVIKKSKLSSASPEKVLIYQLAVSVLVVLVLLPFSGDLVRDPTPLAVGSILFQAVFIVGLTYLVWFWLVSRYPASGLSSFAFLTPAFSVLMGALLLGEPLSWKIGLALTLIAIGLSLVNRPARSKGVPNA